MIRISESEAARNFAFVLTRIREGAEVIIERDAKPVAVVCPAETIRGRPILNLSRWRKLATAVARCLRVLLALALTRGAPSRWHRGPALLIAEG
jgi:antitoxin (DNA-binding transcriptional repressor) of toxin-antitoxin stability system